MVFQCQTGSTGKDETTTQGTKAQCFLFVNSLSAAVGMDTRVSDTTIKLFQ